MCHCQVVFSAEKNGTTGRDDMRQVAVALAKHWPGENVFSEPCSTYPRTWAVFGIKKRRLYRHGHPARGRQP